MIAYYNAEPKLQCESCAIDYQLLTVIPKLEAWPHEANIIYDWAEGANPSRLCDLRTG